jgi:molybdopterin synthase sulfur carrier subunit
MPQFRIPGPLRRLSGGQITVDVEATDLGSAIEALDARYPGFRDRLLDAKGELRQFVNVYLNDEDVRLGPGLKAKVSERDEISIVPAVAGGLIPNPSPSRLAGRPWRDLPTCGGEDRLGAWVGDGSN